MVAQAPGDPAFAAHSSTLCALVVQMLSLHDFLDRKASMQCLLVVLLACMDSSLLSKDLASSAVALEGVFEVLQNEYGFEEQIDKAEAQQGQEAAWAVLAAVSQHVLVCGITAQVTFRPCHASPDV